MLSVQIIYSKLFQVLVDTRNLCAWLYGNEDDTIPKSCPERLKEKYLEVLFSLNKIFLPLLYHFEESFFFVRCLRSSSRTNLGEFLKKCKCIEMEDSDFFSSKTICHSIRGMQKKNHARFCLSYLIFSSSFKILLIKFPILCVRYPY
jgi:hypothetical protein